MQARRWRTVDRVLSWAVILGGVGQWAVTPRFFPQLGEPAAWWFAGGTVLVLVGALNLLRIRHGAQIADVRRLSIAANVGHSAFYVVLLVGLLEKFMRFPGALFGMAVLFALTLVSFRRLR